MLTQGMYLADRYEILGKIGQGGMSDVYKAKDHVLGRIVAIKVLKAEFAEDTSFVTKFRSEAQAAAALEHPNIVNIYDVGSENGMHYIVMECIEGITLKTYIEKKGRLTDKEAISIAIQVSRGIEAAHNRHIIHRDIKPQNIIISTEGNVKVTDFGIARAATSNTIHADIMGSVHYTSPEQARNGFVDGRSDIYSLGIVMYEMVTGRVPFDGSSTVAVAIGHLQDDLPNPRDFAPELPISLEKIIFKCTQKSPDRRYESIGDLLLDLKKALVSPNLDFVTIAPMGDGRTRVISQEELRQIQQGAAEHTQDAGDSLPELEEDDEEEEGGILSAKMEKIVTIGGIAGIAIILILIVLILCSIFGLFTKKNSGTNDNTTEIEETTDDQVMISLLGLTLEEAQALIKEQELSIGIQQIGTASSDIYAAGQIISQSVEEGETVEANTTIEVVISSGTGEFEIPTLVGETEETAASLLLAAGLYGKATYAYDSEVQEGYVISQTPEAGTSGNTGDTVTYVVSLGVQSIRVADVTNKLEEVAVSELEEAGFEVIVSYSNSDTIAAGYVISQTPEGNTYKETGYTVMLVVSSGKTASYYSYHKSYDTGISTIVESSISVVLLTGDGEEVDVSFTLSGSTITVSADNIADSSSGSLTISFMYAGSNDEDLSYSKTYNVSFTKQ